MNPPERLPPVVRRRLRVPDKVRVARAARAPEVGPRVLFFSGGSALRQICRRLKLYTHNSIHLITPFDSGGSSAKLREAFGMLSVGDVRNRLMALADESVSGNPEIYRLFGTRLPADELPLELRARLDRLLSGEDPLLRAVPKPMARLIRTQLEVFGENMPEDFDLRHASVGNLVLAGGYLSHGRDIDAVAFLFSRLVKVRGTVRPIVDADLHLCTELSDGRQILGQHRLTGKEVDPISVPVAGIRLSSSLEQLEPAQVAIDDFVRSLILDAELICYPIGSFYSSVIANLLPRGVGRAVVENICPKLYIPNLFPDPEQYGMSLVDGVHTLLHTVRADAGADTPVEAILDFVAVDPSRADPAACEEVRALGIEVLELPLCGPKPGRIAPEQAVELLLSLV